MKKKKDTVTEKNYNVFLSWSGPRSQALALFFYKWLPRVIQVAKPFYSTVEISKGATSFEEIREALISSSFGIAFVTRENSQEPWLHLEIGALWGDRKRFSPFMIDEDIGEIKGPIPTVQQTKPDRDDVLRLIHSIRDILIPDLSNEVVDRAFEREWSDLEQKIKEVQNTTIEEKKKEPDEDSEALQEGLKPLHQRTWSAVSSTSRNAIALAKVWAPLKPKYIYISKPYKETSTGKLRQDLLVKTYPGGYLHGKKLGRYKENWGFDTDKWDLCLLSFEEGWNEPVKMIPTFGEVCRNGVPEASKELLLSLLEAVKKIAGKPIDLSLDDL